MKKILSLTMAFLLSASVSLFSSCQYIDGSLDAFPSFSSENTECTAHSFGEWETVKEASCIAGEKQRICETCDFKETEEIPASNDFFAHSFDENTLCTTCGHQEFIESEEYITKNTDYGSLYTWMSADGSYGLQIMSNSFDTFIYGYVGTPINVIIPTNIDGKFIESIGGGYGYGSQAAPFKNCKTLETIITTVVCVSSSAFQGCSNLKQLSLIGNNFELVADYAFRDCISLTTITLPSTTQFAYLSAFLGCESLESINVSQKTELYSFDNPQHNYTDIMNLIKYYD